MKKILVDNSQEILVDTDDFHRYLSGNVMKVTADGYILVSGMGLLHRLIATDMYGYTPKIVDHKNRNKLDNRRSNLREATKSTNGMNRPAPKTNTSGYKGVSLDISRNQWAVTLTIDQKTVHGGRFDTPEEAAYRYDELARQYFGEFAVLNFPETVKVFSGARRASRRSSLGVKGVSLYSATGKFSARCKISGYEKFLGFFDTKEEAVEVYDQYVISIGYPDRANTPRFEEV